MKASNAGILNQILGEIGMDVNAGATVGTG